MWSALLAAVNWTLLLTETPKVVSSARRLYESVSQRGQRVAIAEADDEAAVSRTLSDAVDELTLRVGDIENGLERQAELSSRMAAQERALSEGLRTVFSRATAALWLAGAALVVAAATLVVTLLR